MSLAQLKKDAILNSISNEKKSLDILLLVDKDVTDYMKKLTKNNDIDGLITHLDSDECLVLKNFPHRYRRGVTLWRKAKSTPEHFMHETCNTNENYMDAPVEDLYNKSPYQDRLLQAGFLNSLSNHKVVIQNTDLFSITYTESTDKNMITDVTTIHPHCITHTVQEMFKVMIEWQWAYHELASEEPMAVFCNDILLYLGLDYRNLEQDAVVKSIMSLPPMYVEQFLNGNEVIKPTTQDPEEPLEFKLWASKKGIYSYKREKYHKIYETCLKIKILEKKLLEI